MKPKVRCICGREIAKSALKNHLRRGLSHWDGRSLFDNGMTEDTIDHLVFEVKMFNHRLEWEKKQAVIQQEVKAA